ncbi:MAG: sigma-70 family RNA polymerase sigma factor [Oscillospiraceae bacterium]
MLYGKATPCARILLGCRTNFLKLEKVGSIFVYRCIAAGCRSPPSQVCLNTNLNFGGITMLLNLKKYYNFCTDDCLVEVPQAVADVLVESNRTERNYRRRLRWNKVLFSLEADEGIETHIFNEQPLPEDIVAQKALMQQLFAAIGTLSPKQANRVHAYFFLNMSMTEIAQAEGVAQSSVSESIKGALKALKKYFEEEPYNLSSQSPT